MMVALVARTPCFTCGYQHRVVRVSPVRVNKLTLRETGVSLVVAGYPSCPECGEPNEAELMPVSRYRLDPEDEKAVREYRARKWPG